jgi:phospholipase C
MTRTDRRTFLNMLGSGLVGAALPHSITRALAVPANTATGTIADIEHVVFLMQENRSFDHYFGTLNGVRGFSDPRAILLPSGKSVFHQPTANGFLLPFRPDAHQLGLQFVEDLPHNWSDTHAAWNSGRYDQWVPAKGTTTMAHMTREDIPFHYALADAFTICDAYHCSVLGPTDPNRHHMWTGWVGNDGTGGGPVLDNAEKGYGWSTYPERLQKAGINWKIYQDSGQGLTAKNQWGSDTNPYIGNYGDNALLYFESYQKADPGGALYKRARVGTNISAGGTLFDALIEDVKNNSLPQVSWIVAPEAYSEHPNWPPNYGAWYISQVLDALTSNPEVWSKTALFLIYDENDGFFDHMVPPTPPVSRTQGLSTVDTAFEIFPGNQSFASGPIGLGVRVPMIVISPWSKGGFVCSELFDHTSLIRFLEQRFAGAHPDLIEPNITPWRRAVSGDLTAAFNFEDPNNQSVSLPSTAGYVPSGTNKHPDFKPEPPSDQHLPKQEPGARPARGLPYELHADGDIDIAEATLKIAFRNTGRVAAVYQVRSHGDAIGPRTYTVGPQRMLSDAWLLAENGETTIYDVSVYGPNGFFRRFKGDGVKGLAAKVKVTSEYDIPANRLTMTIANGSSQSCGITVTDAYTGEVLNAAIAPKATFAKEWPLDASSGWYDLTVEIPSETAFMRHIAGHLETGKDSYTDPAISKRGHHL